MKLYDFALAPNPRRVRMFLAEKSVEIPLVEVNTRERQQFQESFRKINPFCTVPVLELDDGTCIAESVAICRYIEALHPEPVLMGRDATDTAVVEMWNRRVEFQGYLPASEMIRNSAPMFADRGIAGVESGVPQIPALADRGRQSLGRFFAMLDRRLGESPFIAGDAFTIADITAFVTIEFAKRGEVTIPESGADNVRRWHAGIAARPSADA